MSTARPGVRHSEPEEFGVEEVFLVAFHDEDRGIDDKKGLPWA
jgi:hypothetical protein